MLKKQKIIPEQGESKWDGKIRKSTATALGRTGVVNKAGINYKAYLMMLRGNIGSGVTNDR